jgi:hypothetical protein
MFCCLCPAAQLAHSRFFYTHPTNHTCVSFICEVDWEGLKGVEMGAISKKERVKQYLASQRGEKPREQELEVGKWYSCISSL